MQKNSLDHTKLMALSPLDGRYRDTLVDLQNLFSEKKLLKERTLIELHWLIFLTQKLRLKSAASQKQLLKYAKKIVTRFSMTDAKQIKAIEQTTAHDIKAVEYFLQRKLKSQKAFKSLISYLHFGCTSDDINNLAYARLLQSFRQEILSPTVQTWIKTLKKFARRYAKTSMLARTHGQPATPTTFGKEMMNFAKRIEQQLTVLNQIQIYAKWNGATGNYNAHVFAYPNINWIKLNRQFIASFKLQFQSHTTQIEPHDYIAEFAHAMIRINTIGIQFCRDIWYYFSLHYISLSTDQKTVGSSTMPHKINPILFENAEGNFGLSNALLSHIAEKLPCSRLQRDLTDSTVLRNLGVAFGYAVLALRTLLKALPRLEVNQSLLRAELNQHHELLAEPLQTLMRRYGIADAYEQLKKLTRGQNITRENLHTFVDTLSIPKQEKIRFKKLTPDRYLGYSVKLSRREK